MRDARRALFGISVGLALVGCDDRVATSNHTAQPGGDTAQPGDATRSAFVATDDPLGEAVTKIVYLNQNWSPDDSTRFYFTSQGSHLIPYDWFLALEQADSSIPFRDNKNILKYRYLPQNPGPMNPDGLPVGFVADEGVDRRWVGFTCAACHTNEIRLGNTGYRIDGAPTHADAQAFLADLMLALRQTRDNPEKFTRFAAKAGSAGPDGLRDELSKLIEIRDGYNRRNFLGYNPNATTPEPPERYGTLDAVDAIVNEVFWRTVKDPDPAQPTVVAKPCDAAVSYPFLWDTPQIDNVEWLGFAPNGKVGESIEGAAGDVSGLPRNVGEVLGVFGEFFVHDNPGLLLNLGYSSSVRFTDLVALNKQVKTLWSPAWPADFPAIDRASAALGKALYEKPSAPNLKDSCLDCHAVVDRETLDRSKISIKAKISDEGTDPQAGNNFYLVERPSGKLEGVNFPGQPKILSPTLPKPVVLNVVKGVLFGFYRSAPPDPLRSFNFSSEHLAIPSEPFSPHQYKGRPLDGIWATAPYLHNGSVPTLDDLLKPEVDRPKSFSVGVRTFDPVKVGYLTNAPGFPRFEVSNPDGTAIVGHSNAGHVYGTRLSADERKQLIEYLKTL
jgi:hypothetical protein